MGELWRSRKWRKLLNLIDHLPPDSYYYAALMNDDEAVKQIAEAQEASRVARRDAGEDVVDGPSQAIWSPTVEMLAKVKDEVRGLRLTLIAVNSEKGAQQPAFEAEPRPVSAYDRERKRAHARRRAAAHERLTQRLLPHKHPPTDA